MRRGRTTPTRSDRSKSRPRQTFRGNYRHRGWNANTNKNTPQTFERNRARRSLRGEGGKGAERGRPTGGSTRGGTLGRMRSFKGAGEEERVRKAAPETTVPLRPVEEARPSPLVRRRSGSGLRKEVGPDEGRSGRGGPVRKRPGAGASGKRGSGGGASLFEPETGALASSVYLHNGKHQVTSHAFHDPHHDPHHGFHSGFHHGFRAARSYGELLFYRSFYPFGFHYGYTPFYSPFYSTAAGYWYGYTHSPFLHTGYSHHGAFFGHYRRRFFLGFGFNYYPGYFGSVWYPYYRCYSYYPYYYYSTVTYYPAYAPVYHSSYSTVPYAATTDPYVEYVDDVPGEAPSVVPAIPDVFATPFVKDFPEGLSAAEYLSKGEAWLAEGNYAYAAEAFRRAWEYRPDDYYAPFQLTLALFGMGRHELATYALVEGLDRNASWIHRRMDVGGSFAGPEEFETLLRDLQRHAVADPDDRHARFLLGYLYLFSGRSFEAHSEFTALKRAGSEFPYLESFIKEASARVLGAPETRKAR